MNRVPVSSACANNLALQEYYHCYVMNYVQLMTATGYQLKPKKIMAAENAGGRLVTF